MSSYYEKILATGEVKCIDDEIPFEVPQGWEWCRIGNIFWVTKLAGFEYTKFFTKDAITSTNAVPIVRAQNVRIGKFEENKNEAISITLSNQLERSSLIKKCLLMTFIGAGIGDVCIFPAYRRNHLAPNVAKIEPFNNDCFLEFFLIALMSPLGQLGVNSIKKSTAQPSLSMETIRQILIPIPPLSEQERIVDKIGLVMPIIDKYSKSQELLDKMNVELNECLKKSVLQEAIQGKLVPQIAEEGTAQELLEQIKKVKQKLVKEGKLKKSALASSVIFRGDDNKYYEQIGKKCLDITEQIPFEIPSNWEWCRVRNVSNSYIGLTYKPTDIDKKGTIVLRSCNIRNGKLALDDIVRVSSSISEKLLIEENDIIICARNGSKRLIGKSALIRNLPEPMTFGAFMAICKTPIYEYMFAYLQSDLFFGQLRDVSNTTTINQLTQNKFNDFLIPIPPVKEQERIAFKISQLFQELR